MTESRLRRMDIADLERVWHWRNHPDVRRFMFTSHEIPWEEHSTWFERVSARDSVDLLIYEIDAEPAGFASLTDTRHWSIADWGFYLDPNAPRGTGKGLGRAVLRYGFEQRKLHKLCGQALGFNERSIAFHRALGFKEEGRFRDQHFDGHRYHDILCFGLLEADWLSNETGGNS